MFLDKEDFFLTKGCWRRSTWFGRLRLRGFPSYYRLSPRDVFVFTPFCLKGKGKESAKQGCKGPILIGTSVQWDPSQRLSDAAAVIRHGSFCWHRCTTPVVCLSGHQTPAALADSFRNGPASNPGERQLAGCPSVFSGTSAMLNIIVSSLSWNCNLHKHKRQNPHLKKKCFRRFLTIVSCWGVISCSN